MIGSNHTRNLGIKLGHINKHYAGFNVFIQNGNTNKLNTTYNNANGQGNLFLGYNLTPGTQTGSHNLVSVWQ